MSAERLRADVFRLRRRKFAWAVPLLLVLAVLLVAALAFNLANLDTGGESIPQATAPGGPARSEEHTSELQSRGHLVCRLLLEKKKKKKNTPPRKKATNDHVTCR